MEQFSVLMSLYIKEKAEYFHECMESLLRQTVMPTEIVIVLDGPISCEVEAELKKYENENSGLIKRVPLEHNVGLGLALREGILHCSNEIIARMDTDDIAREDRFEKQLVFLLNNDVDVCSSSILEFSESVDKIIGERVVPEKHDEIIKYQKQRSAFNHMAVMYRKSKVLQAGNYENCPLMEDDMLWVRMIIAGAKCGNIREPLVFARTNLSMIARRGGISYYKKYKNAKKQIYNTGFISFFDYKYTCLIQFFVCLCPKKIRKFIFFKILHKNKGE